MRGHPSRNSPNRIHRASASAQKNRLPNSEENERRLGKRVRIKPILAGVSSFTWSADITRCVRIPQDLNDLAAGGAGCAIISLLDSEFTSLGQSHFKPWFAARPS